MENHTEEKPLRSLEEFVQSQQLVEWPVTCEENQESCSHLYSDSEELHKELKTRVPFPNDITKSLEKNLETLLNKIKRQHSVLSGAPPLNLKTGDGFWCCQHYSLTTEQQESP